MTNSLTLYSLVKSLKTLNSGLADNIILSDMEELPSLIDDKSDNVILFSPEYTPDILILASHDRTKANRYICISENLDAEDRLILLNHNIEFITPEKFSQINEYFFQLRSNLDKHKVLLVEDDESQIMITELILKNAGFAVKSISKGAEVLSTMSSFAPDLILMDLYLEGITGDKLVKVIRKVPKFRFIPIVFLTADTTEASRMQVLNAGADDLLTKPINTDLLVSAIKNRIERSVLSQTQINHTDTIIHAVDEQEQTKLINFINNSLENFSATIVWFKVNNQHTLQKKLGYLGYKNLCKNLFINLPTYDIIHEIKLELTDGVFAFAAVNLDRNKATEWVIDIQKWLTKNYFSIEDKDYYLDLTTIILADIPNKTDRNLLLRKAENLLIDEMTSQPITFLEEGIEEKRFYLIKTQIEDAIKTRNLKWHYQTIVATKDEAQEIYQLMLRVITPEGKELTSVDYLDIANKTGMLRVLDRFTLEHAIRLIRAGEQKQIHTKTLLNQNLFDYQSKDQMLKRLNTIKNLKLPKGSMIFQFERTDAEQYISLLGEIGIELKLAGISVCLSSFDCSAIAWKIARRLHVDWIRLNPQFSSPTGLDEERMEKLKSTISKAHTLGYKVIVSKVDSASLAANLWKLNIDYLQGNFIQAPVKKIVVP
ncbi:MAG: EAL domain-containing protein [Proteobacteria bacterium]|nr:EAL domain-containing protein [Pseudomonadota bacterium]